MADKIATREAYGDALVEFGAKYDKLVVLDADLAEATKTGKFKKAYPDRFFDCGIAEGNMVAVAGRTFHNGTYPLCKLLCNVHRGTRFRADQKLDRLPAPQCQDRRYPCRHHRRRGRRNTPVPRGHRHNAHHPRHDNYQPGRRCRGKGGC